MCGRFALLHPDQIAAHFKARAVDWVRDVPPNFNVAPTHTMPVVRVMADARVVSPLRWGLVPSWAKDLKIGARMINARSETAPTKGAFKSSWRKRRCLIPATHFYEWRTEGKNKLPHLIRPADGSLFAFAGLWAQWAGGPEPIESFTILTCDAAGGLGDLHDRSPVPLAPEQWAQWLDPSAQDAQLTELMRPVRDVEIVRVNPRVNSVRNNDAACVEPWQPEPVQLEL